LIQETQSFGARLKGERERRGISLDSIAEGTKIQKAFLEGLERGDFSKWPAGEVFRRAYLRDYAAAIGLAPEPIVCEFIRLVPPLDELSAPPVAEAASLAISFDRTPNWRDRLECCRTRAALLDALAVLALGVSAAFVFGIDAWTVTGTLAFIYYPITSTWGRSVGSWIVDPRRRLRLNNVSVARPSPMRALVECDEPALMSDDDQVLAAVGAMEVVVDPVLLGRSDSHASTHSPQTSAAH